MKKIDYTDRARYNEFKCEDTEFITTFIERYGIESSLEIPCATGRNLYIISDKVKYAYFGDINEAMISKVSLRILQSRLLNCKAAKLDLVDLSPFPEKIDVIFIMQQSFQLLEEHQIYWSLKNMKDTFKKYVVIDLYDYSSNSIDKPYYLSQMTTHEFVDDFGNRIGRTTELRIDGRKVILTHKYVSEGKEYTADITLTNYSRTQFINICENCGYKIKNVFSNYKYEISHESGRMIFVLEKGDYFDY